LRPDISKRLIAETVKFHGHLGPFLILGLKAGLLANRVLGKDPIRTRAIVETDPKPPRSCVIDGIQVATGCTMGKRNIELKRSNRVSITFTRGERSLRLCLRREVLEGVATISSVEEAERMALALASKPVQELFETEKGP